MGHEARPVSGASIPSKQSRETARWAGTRPLFLYSLRDPALKLRNPIAVTLEDDGEQIIAIAYDLDIFGYGESESDALDDLRKSISDLYSTLKESQSALGPLPQRVWDYLSDIVEERRVA